VRCDLSSCAFVKHGRSSKLWSNVEKSRRAAVSAQISRARACVKVHVAAIRSSWQCERPARSTGFGSEVMAQVCNCVA